MKEATISCFRAEVKGLCTEARQNGVMLYINLCWTFMCREVDYEPVQNFLNK